MQSTLHFTGGPPNYETTNSSGPVGFGTHRLDCVSHVSPFWTDRINVYRVLNHDGTLAQTKLRDVLRGEVPTKTTRVGSQQRQKKMTTEPRLDSDVKTLHPQRRTN